MDLIDQGISVLKTKRFELVESALQSPNGRDTFEFGRVCGTYQGLKMAEDTLTDLQNAADEQENLR